MINRRVKLGGLVAVITLVFNSILPLAAFAATTNPNGAFNVIVTPTSKLLSIKPGTTGTETIQFKNQGVAPENIKISLLKFSSDNKDGLPVLANPGPNDTFINWVKFSTPTFTAPPGVWVPITVTISPPPTAAFAYDYAVVFERANPQTQSHVANLVGSAASLILLDVPAPGEVRKAVITQFSTDHNIYEFLPVTFNIKMQNTGNVHIAPRGNIFITQGGKTVAMLNINFAESNILPHSSRIFTAQWTDGAPSYQPKMSNGYYVVDKQNKVETSLVWKNLSLSKLRFGKYNAKLVMVYNDGEGDFARQANLTFWVMPWRIIAGVVVVLILVIGGLWALLFRPLLKRVKSNRRGNVKLR